jgi:hypothetical protein
MSGSKHTAWSRHFDAIGDELSRLSVACGVDLADDTVVERILRDDETVCGIKNPVGFRKLRQALLATYNSLNKAVGRIGDDEVRQIVAEVRAHLARRREIGRGHGGQPGGSGNA